MTSKVKENQLRNTRQRYAAAFCLPRKRRQRGSTERNSQNIHVNVFDIDVVKEGDETLHCNRERLISEVDQPTTQKENIPVAPQRVSEVADCDNGAAENSRKRQRKQQDFKSAAAEFSTAGPPIVSVKQPVKTDELLSELRRRSIQAKLYSQLDPVFTREEEQDINERAEIYAINTAPDKKYYILPDNQGNNSVINIVQYHSSANPLSQIVNGVYSHSKKKKRRSYNNIDCYVTNRLKPESLDNMCTLPTGTRLLKPPCKLVDLVAQVTDQSPDGLLQVQQIYTILQNKYPYFRYMDKAAISSWRSSIRHALYQKWFRKIPFATETINCKGCFWTLNQRFSSREWLLTKNPACDLQSINLMKGLCLDQEAAVAEGSEVISACKWERHAVKEETSHEIEESLKDVIQIAQEYGINFSDCVNEAVASALPAKDSASIPSPVKDPDPMLVTCAADWKTNSSSGFDSEEGPMNSNGCISVVYGQVDSIFCPQSSCESPRFEGESDDHNWTTSNLADIYSLQSPSVEKIVYGLPFSDASKSQYEIIDCSMNDDPIFLLLE